LDNWIKKFELDCASETIIGSFGMLFFIGFSLGSLIVARLSDKYGRKRIFL
jgi:MFS family permease